MGDLNANVAMTKKGFGEMAITGCMAGPIFNVLVGLGISTALSFNSTTTVIAFSLTIKNEQEGIDQFNKAAVLPLCLTIATMISVVVIGINGVLNSYRLSQFWCLVNVFVYAAAILILVIYTMLAPES